MGLGGNALEACDVGGALSDDYASAWCCHQIEPRQYHILKILSCLCSLLATSNRVPFLDTDAAQQADCGQKKLTS
jgi:hypothetical protein